MVEEWRSTFWQVPLYNVEAWNPILAPYSVQVTTKHSHTHAGTTGTGGGHIAAPLVGFRIISETGKTEGGEKVNFFRNTEAEQ